MTTKPKAERFRIRKPSAEAQPKAQASESATATAMPQQEQQLNAQNTRSAITVRRPRYREHSPGGLERTSIAHGATRCRKRGASILSDYEAVKVLRDKGIDPFQKNNLLDLVTADKTEKIALPQKVATAQLPVEQAANEAPEMSPERRAKSLRVQRDLTRCRRRNTLMLTLRVFAFISLPTFVAGYYYAMSQRLCTQQSRLSDHQVWRRRRWWWLGRDAGGNWICHDH